MKVGLFEWLSGGGLSSENRSASHESLLKEGWAMLSLLVEQFALAGHDVMTVVDSELRIQAESLNSRSASRLSDQACGSIQTIAPSFIRSQDQVLVHWAEVARQCDLSLVIAPEIDGILESCIHQMIQQKVALLNCTGEFLKNCCDKWKTAQRLSDDGIPHPPTWLASEAEIVPRHLSDRWCCKSRWGAGCDAMRVTDAKNLVALCQGLGSAAQWIIQPWLEGQSFSCSAVADRSGNLHWLPLTTQKILLQPTPGTANSVIYLGGKVLNDPNQQRELLRILNRALQALSGGTIDGCCGWISFDLLKSTGGEWFIVEVNPRVTTSIIGLSKAGPYNFANLLLSETQTGHGNFSRGKWSEVEFHLE